METNFITQYNKQIEKSQSVAILLPDVLSVDLLASAIALEQALVSKNKQVALFSSAEQLPNLGFFAESPVVNKRFNTSGDLLIKVSGKTVAPKSVRYQKSGQDLEIFVSPQENESKDSFVEEDVLISPAQKKFDCLIVLGAASVEELGELYKTAPEVFFDSFKMAISNKSDHEYFAAVNIVDTEAASLAEVVYELLEAEQGTLFKKDLISTGLLAGIVAQTQSFKNPRTTPETLAKAARLVEFGARQQDVVKYLFKTKAFDLLQLWGRAMARIKDFPGQSFLFSVLTERDFNKTKTEAALLPEVAVDLVEMASGYNTIAIAAEVKSGVRLLLAGLPHVKIRKIAHAIASAEDLKPKSLVANYRYIEMELPGKQLNQIEQLLLPNIPKV